MVKNRLCSWANWSAVRRSKPVAWSGTPPVARWYAVKASEAMRMSVVPVSTMPAVVCKITVEVP